VWQSFVALGDSFTEGLEDGRPDGSYRGWADLVAERIAVEHSNPGDFRYANLAVRGKRMEQIVEEQVPRALAMQPELVSLVGGVNDLLRPNFDLDLIASQLSDSVAAFRNSGTDVLLLVGANPAARSTSMIGRMSNRLDALNQTTADVARDQDCLVVNVSDVDIFYHMQLWSEDRLHLSTLGHERVSGAFIESLGLGDSSWREPLPAMDSLSTRERVLADSMWAGKFLVPWLGRRLTGRSSGDGRVAKRPDLAPL
jgi:lysophospholipase L1-like esterase